MTDTQRQIQNLIGDLAQKLDVLIAQTAAERILEAFDPKGRNAPRAKQRRKGPIQLCPVPGCKERAAPVFGMVCAKHKNLPKSKIKAYRAARRARAAKGRKG